MKVFISGMSNIDAYKAARKALAQMCGCGVHSGHPLANVGLDPFTGLPYASKKHKSRKSDRKRNRANRWR